MSSSNVRQMPFGPLKNFFSIYLAEFKLVSAGSKKAAPTT